MPLASLALLYFSILDKEKQDEQEKTRFKVLRCLILFTFCLSLTKIATLFNSN